MRRVIFSIILTYLIISQPLIWCDSNIPKKGEGYVNDYAHAIDKDYYSKIGDIIRELENKTSVEMAIVTVNSIAPLDEKAYARAVFDTWKIGKKDKDNGILILLAIKERRWRIETGYGIESVLTDGRCGEIGRENMVPFFKNGEYGKGLHNGASAIAKIIFSDLGILSSRNTLNVSEDSSQDVNAQIPLLVIFFTAIFFINIFSNFFTGLAITILISIFLSSISYILGIIGCAVYFIAISFRFFKWRHAPADKRKNFFKSHGLHKKLRSGYANYKGWGNGESGWGRGPFGGGRGGGGGSGGGF